MQATSFLQIEQWAIQAIANGTGCCATSHLITGKMVLHKIDPVSFLV
jgi:hypothetical protein